MSVFLIIEDTKEGNVNIKSLVQPTLVGDKPAETPALELGHFLMTAAQVWRETKNMTDEDAHAHIDAMRAQHGRH